MLPYENLNRNDAFLLAENLNFNNNNVVIDLNGRLISCNVLFLYSITVDFKYAVI